jgi:2-C-methyl-D-erythritol 4-phosphate cytidylyltransferase
VARYCPDLPIRIVDGDRNNIKLTYSEDLRTIQRLLSH